MTARYYGAANPINGRTIVVGRMRGIRRKLERLNDGRVLTPSPRRGPHPVTYTLKVPG